MNFKLRVLVLLVAGLALIGSLRGLMAKNAGAVASDHGLREIAADFLWVRAYVWWERRDVVMTTQTLKQVAQLNPRSLHFWINGARMMAYDMPSWRGSDDPLTRVAIRARITEEQAVAAIHHLQKAREYHPRNAALWIEQGNIELNRLHDISAAAESYRHAAEFADAPYYVARIHAELLRRAGRKKEAYAWLCQLHPALPRHDPEAAAGLVLARIRDLERELLIPMEASYRGDGP